MKDLFSLSIHCGSGGSLQNNPNKEGRGLALAGLITGIIGTAGGLLLLLLAYIKGKPIPNK
jgi:hypothetical protein